MASTPEFTLNQLTGRSRTHLEELKDPPCALHIEVVRPFLAMRAAAAADGIELVAFSTFRDFDRQLAIWNGKFRGERPLQDRGGKPLDALALSPAAERVTAILWWSALPGASRHHWGTDFDVVDARAKPPDYKLRVVPEEYLAGGPFHRLPWHLSHAPVAARAEAAFSLDGLREVLVASAIDGKNEVLAALESYYRSYVVNVDAAPESALMSPGLV
jgi:LAS superfamily LD-carboxypeptidase LdcB